MRNEEEITVITHPVFDYRLPHHVLELLNEWEKLAPKNTFFIHTHTHTHRRDAELSQWKNLPCQGSGVEHFYDDSISNAWLKFHCGFSEHQFLTALKLRSKMHPTIEYLGRGKHNQTVNCRHCSASYESLAHILGQCPAVQGTCIRRHKL